MILTVFLELGTDLKHFLPLGSVAILFRMAETPPVLGIASAIWLAIRPLVLFDKLSQAIFQFN